MYINKRNLELALGKAGITQAQLAERCGISRQNISTIKLRGSCNPYTAAKLALGLEVDLEYLTKEE